MVALQAALRCVSHFAFLFLSLPALEVNNTEGAQPRTALGAPPGPPPSAGLYELACRASHSCQPNTFCFSDLEGRRVMRTLTAVEAGEEVRHLILLPAAHAA